MRIKLGKRFQILTIAAALCLPTSLFAENLPVKSIRYAYTPVMLSKESYVSVVTPASYIKANQKLTGIIGQIHSQFKKVFNSDLRVNVGIKLLPKKQFFEETGAPQWTNAMYFQNQILIPVEDFKTINWNKLKQTIVHEYTHAIIASLTEGACPAWVDEGLAQLIEHSDNKVLEKTLVSWLEKNPIIPLRNLKDGFTSLSLAEIGPAYAQSKIAVNLLLNEHGGVERLFDFIQLTKNNTEAQAFYVAYGFSLKKFEKELASKLQNLDARKTLLASRDHALIF